MQCNMSGEEIEDPVPGTLYEGCGEEGPVRSIFLAEFHHLEGPRIRCQAFAEENDYLVKDVFDSVSNYIIPKPQLARQTITLNALGYKILGYPVILEDKKYKRNIFIFNVCFVCHPWSRTVQYECAIKKLHDCLVNLELECEFVSREENTSIIREIINKIHRDINEFSSCHVSVGISGGPSQKLHLKLTPIPLSPEQPVVHDHDVPVLLVDWTIYSRDAWDLTTRELLKFMDGFNHIARIADLVGVETHLVKSDVANLICYGVAKVIPILSYSDSYAITPRLRKLREDPSFQKDCANACAVSSTKVPSFRSIYSFIAEFSQGSSRLESIVSRFKIRSEHGLCEKKLIKFLLLNNIIRKIHKYPVYIKDEEGLHDSIKNEEYYKIFTGQRHLDEIGVKMEISVRELEEKFELDPQIHLLRK